jgi:Domain of unknown function (DUF4232)
VRVFRFLGSLAALVAATAAGPSSSAGAAPSGPPATTSCAPSTLRLGAVDVVAGLGNNALVLRYTNAGPTRCWIRGYAGVTVYGAPRAIVAGDSPSVYMGGLQRLGGAAVSLRTEPVAWLAHGRSAYELVGSGDNPAGTARTCPVATGIVVRLTARRASGTVRMVERVAVPRWWLCAGATVTPIVPFVVQRLQGATYHERGSYFVR